ncbi:MAG TPA: hypothetical protein VK656_01875 [Candidatus Acidoferrum sp.]|nr:hypothetical protein [Candidatus Acidoferrum sp.]
MAKATAKEDDGSLKRLGGGRWQTRDERFTIEPQSGTWVVVDGEQTDDLGLPLVRGPFSSLTAAKAAIAAARGAAPAVSPLAARVAEVQARRATPPTTRPAPGEKAGPSPKAKSEASSEATKPSHARAQSTPKPASNTEPPPEPAWLTGLTPADRRRAHELIDRLTKAGAPDPEGIARRDVAGKVPAAAAYAVAKAVAALGNDASSAAIAEVLIDGRDAELGVRWRLVDGDGRPITVDLRSP